MQLHYDGSKFLMCMRLQFATTTSLDEKMMKSEHVIHYWWHPLMVDNQVVFAITFAISYGYVNR